ncbi:MAG: hypothetical protein K2O85_01720, partial [Helicobacter sp.]|nr:hypothetical protein [Helicobacter sp.]
MAYQNQTNMQATKMLRKIFVASALFAGVASNTLLAAEADKTKLYDPKSEKKHIVIPMAMLGDSKDTPVGEVVAVQTQYG